MFIGNWVWVLIEKNYSSYFIDHLPKLQIMKISYIGTKRFRQNKIIIKSRDPLSNLQRCEFRIHCNDLIKSPIEFIGSCRLNEFLKMRWTEVSRSYDSSQIYSNHISIRQFILFTWKKSLSRPLKHNHLKGI